MFRRNLWAVLLVATSVVATLLTDRAISQDGDHDMSPEAMQEMMQQWRELMQPNEHHEALSVMVGEWDTTMKMWWGGPGTEPMVSEGECEIEWALGGRWLVEESEFTIYMPDEEGNIVPCEMNGLALTGYDNNRNMYRGIWVDDMGTALTTMTGSMSPDGRTLTMYGEMDEPMLNVIGRLVKYQTTIVDENTRVFRMYDLHAGDDYLVMEVTYERADDDDDDDDD